MFYSEMPINENTNTNMNMNMGSPSIETPHECQMESQGMPCECCQMHWKMQSPMPYASSMPSSGSRQFGWGGWGSPGWGNWGWGAPTWGNWGWGSPAWGNWGWGGWGGHHGGGHHGGGHRGYRDDDEMTSMPYNYTLLEDNDFSEDSRQFGWGGWNSPGWWGWGPPVWGGPVWGGWSGPGWGGWGGHHGGGHHGHRDDEF